MNVINARKARNKHSWRSWRNGRSNNYPQPPSATRSSAFFVNLMPRNKTNSNRLLRIKRMNNNKSQLTIYLKKQTPTNLMLIINDRVSNERSLASSVVASVPSVASFTSIALRTLPALRWMETPLHSATCRVEMTMGMEFPMGMVMPWDCHANGNWWHNSEWE